MAGRPHSSQQTQTKDDLRPAVQLAHSLVDAGIDAATIAFALVKTTRSAAEVAAARSYLEQADYAVLEGRRAGRALTETAYPTLNEKAERLAQSIVDRLVAVTAVAKEVS